MPSWALLLDAAIIPENSSSLTASQDAANTSATSPGHRCSCSTWHEVISSGRVDRVILFLVEKNPENCETLESLVEQLPTGTGVNVRGPRKGEFVEAGTQILDYLRRHSHPSFWFIDPFGFLVLPLSIIREIHQLPLSETLVTFQVRDINRFLTEASRRVAISEILGIQGSELDRAMEAVLASPSREIALRELYETRLKDAAGARYVWTFRVAGRGAAATIYYMIHTSKHPKGFREMKIATRSIGGWRFAFLGKDDFSQTGQSEFPNFGPDDPEQLKRRLLEVFAGRDIAYEDLLNEAVPARRFYWWVDKDFHTVLNELAASGRIVKAPVTSRSPRGLQGVDRLRFPVA